MFPSIVSFLILFTIVLFIWIGFYFRSKARKEGDDISVGPLEGSLLGLLALMLSFSFNSSYSRYNERRSALNTEINSIKTTVARMYILPDSIGNDLKPMMRQYVKYRVNYYKAGVNKKLVNAYFDSTNLCTEELWRFIKKNVDNPSLNNKITLIINSLNSMSESAYVREDMRLATIPFFIKIAILFLILICALVIGYNIDNFKKKRFIVFSFATMISLTCYLILDLEESRNGLINLDVTEAKMLKLHEVLTH